MNIKRTKKSSAYWNTFSAQFVLLVIIVVGLILTTLAVIWTSSFDNRQQAYVLAPVCDRALCPYGCITGSTLPNNCTPWCNKTNCGLPGCVATSTGGYCATTGTTCNPVDCGYGKHCELHGADQNGGGYAPVCVPNEVTPENNTYKLNCTGGGKFCTNQSSCPAGYVRATGNDISITSQGCIGNYTKSRLDTGNWTCCQPALGG